MVASRLDPTGDALRGDEGVRMPRNLIAIPALLAGLMTPLTANAAPSVKADAVVGSDVVFIAISWPTEISYTALFIEAAPRAAVTGEAVMKLRHVTAQAIDSYVINPTPAQFVVTEAEVRVDVQVPGLGRVIARFVPDQNQPLPAYASASSPGGQSETRVIGTGLRVGGATGSLTGVPATSGGGVIASDGAALRVTTRT